MKGRKIFVVFLLLFSILLTSFGFWTYQMLYSPNILVGKEQRVLIIPRGETFKSLQERLYDAHIVNDMVSFSFLAKLMDYDEQVKPGRYVLEPDMNNLTAIRMLRAGRQEPVNITFNNVRLISELGEKITRTILMDETEFNQALNDYIQNNDEGWTEENIIGMNIPNTNEVYYDITGEELIARMNREYHAFWNEERKAKADSLGLSPREVSTLASIVQAESVKGDESPRIAGLYINRLKRNIALQADPTLVFASGDFTLKRVLNVHKEIDSPYNTYMHTGLPPGPINMPTITSLDAVLNYEDHSFLYMCAKEDFSGYHNFAQTLNEHLVNARRYQRALTIEQQKARAAAQAN
ncbi:MAG: endolytic transglycosylase MltG [Cyclobacteriaceae bacterium]